MCTWLLSCPEANKFVQEKDCAYRIALATCSNGIGNDLIQHLDFAGKHVDSVNVAEVSVKLFEQDGPPAGR